MTDESRIAVTDNAIRWTSNILVEVLSNSHGVISGPVREHLRDAISSLSEAQQGIRFPDGEKGNPT